MNMNGMEIRVCVDGKPVPEYGCEGKTIVEGRLGVPFTIKVKNNNAARTHAIVLVDGVNVISGDAATERGYIIEGYSSYTVSGWRRSLNDVATFVFEKKDGSYTKEVKGNTAQCGVISLIAYAEKVKEPKVIEKHIHHHDDHYYDWPWYPYHRPYPYPYPHWPHWQPSYYLTCNGVAFGVGNAVITSGASGDTLNAAVSFTSGGPTRCDVVQNYTCAIGESAAPAASGVNSVLNIGTTWGAVHQDAVNEVPWENGALLGAIELYYTDEAGLQRLGINSKQATVSKTSNFPSGLTGFCQPPARVEAPIPKVEESTTKLPRLPKKRKPVLTKSK